jgi:hypothetical protein
VYLIGSPEEKPTRTMQSPEAPQPNPHAASAEAPAGKRRSWRDRLLGRVDVRVVALSPEGVALPGHCACCGGTADSSRVELRERDGASIIVPYCSDCQRHASAVSTRALAVALASSLLAVTLAAGLPLLGELPAVAYTLIVLAGALLPLAAGVLWRRRPARGHRALGRAVWWLGTGELACVNPHFAAELAVTSGVALDRRTLGEPVLSAWVWVGVILALVTAPFFYVLYHPLVRVVDLTGRRLVVLLDGRAVASVDPTSAESPAAGVELRLPSGHHRLQARDPNGRILSDTTVRIESGAQHLYAPGSDGYCFWLETTGYGRAGPPGPAIRPLSGARRFWVLPVDVDTWFAPNPAPARGDDRSSGGVLTALRQARCADAPAEARP